MADAQDFKIWRPGYTAKQIVAWYGKGPRVNTTTNTWEVWDIAAEKYVNTGVQATGDVGPQGIQGPVGPYPSLQIGNVTTLPAGSQATASITGTVEEPLLNLSLPRGKDGDGAGDMTKFIYDPQNRQEDIFAYVDAHRSNPNLLDNAYFIGGGSQQGGGQLPINHRGQTEYVGVGYGIDRWANNDNAVSITLEENGISFVTTKKVSAFTQKVNYLHLGTYTLSALVKGKKGDVVAVELGPRYTQTVLTGEWQVVSHTIAIDSSGPATARFYLGYNDNGGGCMIQAAKLELGPVQTLAHLEGDTWVLNAPPPNYDLELMKCYWYLQPVSFNAIGGCVLAGTFINLSTSLAAPMRKTPTTLDPDLTVTIREDGKDITAQATVKVGSMVGGQLLLAVYPPNGVTLVGRKFYWCYPFPTTSFLVSAEP